MKTVLVFSAHLDDAAFSVGPLLAELKVQARIVVATVFTKSIANPGAFALACQLDKGIDASADYMLIRRHEDMEWAEIIGVEAVHGPFAEAPHRGYHSAEELFGPISQTDEIGVDLRLWLGDLMVSLKPDMILVPLGIGNHVDHQWVRKAAEAMVVDPLTLAYYQDQPYAAKVNAVPSATHLGEMDPCFPFHVAVSGISLDRALTAAGAYVTQIPFQFGDIDSMGEVLRPAWGENLLLFHTSGIPAYFDLLN